MKKRFKLGIITGVLALSLFSFVYVQSTVSPFNLNQNIQQTELSYSESNEAESKSLLPETKIIEFLADKASSLFSSIVNKD
nr:hypothetical protein [Saprospiraceae bacterium]